MNDFLVGAEVIGSGLGKRYELVNIVLCFNQSKYVTEAVNSVINQDWSEGWHIIIHDDASSDESANKIRKLAEQYPTKVTAILQSQNRYSTGFNIPIELQKLVDSQYIARLDADDFFITTNKLRKQLAVFASSPEVVLVSHPYLVVNEHGNRSSKVVFGKKSRINKFQMLLGNPIATPTAMYRSIAATGMPAKLPDTRIQDWPFWVILQTKGEIAYLQDLESGYREHGENGFARRSNLEFKADNLKAHKLLIEYMGGIPALFLRLMYLQATINFRLDLISGGKATMVSNKVKANLMKYKVTNLKKN